MCVTQNAALCFSQASERDSLDENAVVSMETQGDTGGDSSCNRWVLICKLRYGWHDAFHSNIVQTQIILNYKKFK